jgi:hypothetical protein
MPVTLQTVRYYTENSPYHYTADNEPLQDLEQNDILLKAAVEAVEQSYDTKTVAGNWTGLKVVFDLQKDMQKPFAYALKIWASQDQSVLAGQAATLMQYTIFGYNLNPGNVVLSGNTQLFRHSTGAGTLTPTFTGNGNNLEITFSGYTGNNGYVVAKLERFGI